MGPEQSSALNGPKRRPVLPRSIWDQPFVVRSSVMFISCVLLRWRPSENDPCS